VKAGEQRKGLEELEGVGEGKRSWRSWIRGWGAEKRSWRSWRGWGREAREKRKGVGLE
jgi:hypothetical protein